MFLTPSRNKTCAILGGGISGLACAYFAKQAQVSLFEATSRLGGFIQTADLDGFLFELGPHSLRLQGHEVIVDLIRELGLELVAASSAVKNRFLLLDNKLQKIPSNLLLFALHPLTRGAFRAACENLSSPEKMWKMRALPTFLVVAFRLKWSSALWTPLLKASMQVAAMSSRCRAVSQECGKSAPSF